MMVAFDAPTRSLEPENNPGRTQFPPNSLPVALYEKSPVTLVAGALR